VGCTSSRREGRLLVGMQEPIVAAANWDIDDGEEVFR
jgi:hypothetical protein